MNFKLNCCGYTQLHVGYMHDFVMIFETLQHGILANVGTSPPGHQICTQKDLTMPPLPERVKY
jgi:hypothetical protein